MAIQVSIERLVMDAPDDWPDGADTFRRLLEDAIRQELQTDVGAEAIQAHQALRIDVPPVTVNDLYDVQDIAREIARRVVRAARQSPQTVSQPT